jgi:hypothetical protein
MASEISVVGCVVVTLWTLVESTARLGCRLAQLQQMMGFKTTSKSGKLHENFYFYIFRICFFQK